MKYHSSIFLIVLLIQIFYIAGYSYSSPNMSSSSIVAENIEDENLFLNDQDDPASSSYKDAYKNILKEEWQIAYDKLKRLLQTYPASSYRDDAEYWMAYSLSHYDKPKAKNAYEKFIENNKQSRYYTDAIADLTELAGKPVSFIKQNSVDRNIKVTITNNQWLDGNKINRMAIDSNEITIGNGPESLIVNVRNVLIKGKGKQYSYTFQYEPDTKSVERVLKYHVKMMPKETTTTEVVNLSTGKKYDKKEYHLVFSSEQKYNDESFEHLKKIAGDFTQPNDLREMAIFKLTGFRKPEVESVLYDIAKNDTVEDVQLTVIDYLSHIVEDKDKRVIALSDLYKGLPIRRQVQRDLIMFKIAEIGNDNAINFFYDLAKTENNPEIRQNAIYYLGSIGGTNAGVKLKNLLEQK